MSKKRMITKSVIFLLILAFILKIFSSLSIAMGYNANPLYNYSSYSIFQEPDNSIDVLSIGDSNVYSSIFPLVWWEQQGFTGYPWGQPSQRIPETYEYLKKIYKHQKPSIVLIDGNNLFRDKTDIDNLDSITKGSGCWSLLAKIYDMKGRKVFALFLFKYNFLNRIEEGRYGNLSLFGESDWT